MNKNTMAKISCNNYGFDCKFEVNSEDVDAINRFQKHSMTVHGIEYSLGTLNQILLRIKSER